MQAQRHRRGDAAAGRGELGAARRQQPSGADTEGWFVDLLTENEAGQYVTPAVHDLGAVTETTLGSSRWNEADDTQYFE
jgi:hypothetical protein